MNWFAHAILMAIDPKIPKPAAIGPDDEDLWEVDLFIGEDPDDVDPPLDNVNGPPNQQDGGLDA